MSQSLGQKIGKYTGYQRKKRGYSLNEFARLTDLTPSFLLRLEKGDYTSINLNALQKLSDGFHTTIVDFLTKCEITGHKGKLEPSTLDFFLREKYFFPDEAIADMKLLIALLKVKYKKEISELKKLHGEYWK